MKPAKFNYLSPTTLSEVIEYLEEYGEDAKILSGGQSLIPILNMRLSTPEYVIDIKNIEELKYIKDEDDTIKIGTLTKHVDVEKSSLIAQRCPIIAEAIHFIGHSQIRNRGTIGGSIAHADPSAELPCLISALRGEIVIEGAMGERVVSPDEFFLTYMLTSLDVSELVKEVRFPVLSPTSGYAFVEIARRHGDFALVEVAAVIDLDSAGRISLARLAVGGAGPVPCVLEDIEEFLIGELPTEEIIEAASEQVKDYLEPDSDLHGSVEYRVQLGTVLTKRALKIAFDRAKQGVMA